MATREMRAFLRSEINRTSLASAEPPKAFVWSPWIAALCSGLSLRTSIVMTGLIGAAMFVEERKHIIGPCRASTPCEAMSGWRGLAECRIDFHLAVECYCAVLKSDCVGRNCGR